MLWSDTISVTLIRPFNTGQPSTIKGSGAVTRVYITRPAAACTRRGRCSVHAPAQTAILLLMQSYAKRPADEKLNDKCYINVTGT